MRTLEQRDPHQVPVHRGDAGRGARLRPDVGVIHAQRADREGNVQLWGIIGVQKEVVLASVRSLVTVEEIVDELEPHPGAVVLPPWVTTAVAEAPARRPPVLRARLLRPRQRLLSALGRDQQRPRQLPSLDGGERGMSEAGFTADELMTVAAARELQDRTVCFVGIGLPSTAANLARLTHAPRTVLVYESGTIGSKPAMLPLSIGDGELAETADSVVSVPEIFNYWLQGGRIDVGLPGRGADRSARPPQQHGHRRLRAARRCGCRRRRRARDRGAGQGDHRDHAPVPAHVRGESSTSAPRSGGRRW